MINTKGSGQSYVDCQGFSVRCGALHLTSSFLHLTSLASIFLIKSEGHPRQFEGLFYLSRGRENFSRGGANFYLHWRCKGTKNRDAKQAFLSFISYLFEMLKCKESWMTAFSRCYAVTQLRSFIYRRRSSSTSEASRARASFSNGYLYYIIIYNILYI